MKILTFLDDIITEEELIKDLYCILNDYANSEFEKTMEFTYIDEECDTGKGIMRWTDKILESWETSVALIFLSNKITLTTISKLKNYTYTAYILKHDWEIDFTVKEINIIPHSQKSIKISIIFDIE